MIYLIDKTLIIFDKIIIQGIIPLYVRQDHVIDAEKDGEQRVAGIPGNFAMRIMRQEAIGNLLLEGLNYQAIWRSDQPGVDSSSAIAKIVGLDMARIIRST